MAGPVQILVVDDEEPIRNALKKFLSQQQYEVYAAGTGDEALQQLRRHRIALMLCDIRMPGTSGVDLVPQALETQPDLAILMLTAVNDATTAHQLGLPEEQVEQVRIAGRLHDIGKIGTREAVLNKDGPLTPDEFEHVKQHVVIGSQILAPLAHLGIIIGGVRSHHERWDGNGYPDGLRGEAIPIAARIVATAEVYDALSTSRPYQDKMTPERAVERMADLAGTVLDPKMFEALAAVVARRRTLVFLDEGGGGGGIEG